VPDDYHAASASRVPIRPAFSDRERLALAGFLAGFRGLTRWSGQIEAGE
jgi:hypothetical protein